MVLAGDGPILGGVAIPWFLSSSRRLFGTLFLILALPMLALLAVVALHARAALREVAVDNAIQGAKLVTTSVEEELQGTERYVESYARRPAVAEAMAVRDLARVREHLASMLALDPELTRVVVTDRSGTVLCDHPPDPAVQGRNFSHRDWYRGAAARPGAYVSEIYRRAANGRPWVVSIACGIAPDAESPPVGYLVGQRSIDELGDRLAALRPTVHGQVLLVDPAGQVLARHGAAPLDGAAARAAMAAPGHDFVEVHGVLAVARPLGSTGWHVVVERSLAAILDPVRSITRTVLITFACSLAAMFVVGGFWYRTLREYDAGQRRALEAVRTSEAALSRANEELERRVAERTTALHDEVDQHRRTAEQLRRVDAERAALLEAAERDRAAAEQANRLKDEFLAVVSHELRTPLTPILAWTHILRARHDERTLGRGLTVIERNAKAQAHIVSDLLDISRIVTGKLGMTMRPVDLAEVVRQAMETVRAGVAGKGLDLRCELQPVVVRGDVNRLQQVAWNLLSNAIKFTPRGGKLTVQVGREGSEGVLRVTDTGEGIDAAFLPQVFGRFTQGEAGITRTHGGLGLGLAISRQLVEAHGGSIAADSPGKGAGATFVVRLPLAPLSTEPPDEQPRAGLPTSLEGVRVLVVEDEHDGREVIAMALAGAGADVVTASSGEEALALLDVDRDDGGRFEVLVSDLGLPRVNGFDLVKAVRRRGQDLPAVALTAYAGADDLRRSLEAGFDDHLAKPVDPQQLIDAVARAAHRS